MSKYWQIIYRTGEEEYASKEFVINDDQYKQVQQAIVEGDEFIIIPDKPTIKRSSIASINPYKIEETEAKVLGINPPETLKLKEPTEERKQEAGKEFLNKSKTEFYKKMGWGV